VDVKALEGISAFSGLSKDELAKLARWTFELEVPAGEDLTTEGRLAAFLARHGEGPAGRYVAVSDDLGRARTRAGASGITVSRVEDGPFGSSMLVLISPASGPQLILCEPVAVPSTP
jgi:hypothetical protein